MLRLSAHIHGWTVERITPAEVDALPVFDDLNVEFRPLEEAEAITLGERMHAALRKCNVDANDHVGRFGVAMREVLLEENSAAAVDAALEGRLDPAVRKLRVRGWPTVPVLSGFKPSGAGYAPPETPEDMSTVIRRATEAARDTPLSVEWVEGEFKPVDSEVPRHVKVSKLLADTVFSEPWTVQYFFDTHGDDYAARASGSGADGKGAYLHDFVSMFANWDKTAGMPTGADHAIISEYCSEVWRLVRATSGRTPEQLEAKEMEVIDKSTLKTRPKLHGQELLRLHRLIYLLGIPSEPLLNGEEVSVPEDRVTLFSTPRKGSGERFYHFTTKTGEAKEEEHAHLRQLEKQIVDVCVELFPILKIKDGLNMREGKETVPKSIRKIVGDVVEKWGVCVNTKRGQRVIGKDKNGKKITKDVAKSATMQLDAHVKRVADNMLVTMDDGTKIACRDLSLPEPMDMSLDPVVLNERGVEDSMDIDTSVPGEYVEEGDFGLLGSLDGGGESVGDTPLKYWVRRVRELEALFKEAARPDKRVVKEMLSNAKGNVSTIKSILQCVEWDEVKPDEKPMRGRLRTTYGRRGMGVGRRYANGASIQRLGRADRARVAVALYFDIDICNCHPTLVTQLPWVVSHPERYPTLIAYAEDRNPLRNQVMAEFGCSKDWAKKLFLAMLNCGKFRTWYREGLLSGNIPNVERDNGSEPPESIRRFEEECHRLIYDVTDSRPDMLDKARVYCAKEGDFEQRKCAFSYIMGEVEDAILAVMEQVAKEHGWNMAVLLWDGALLRKRDGMTQADVELVLRKMEARIAEVNGVDIKLEVKPLDAEDFVAPVFDDADEIEKAKAAKADKQKPSKAKVAKRKRGRVVETEGAAKRCRAL